MAEDTKDPAKRDAAGRFGPGNTANPSGRPKLIREFHDWLKQYAYPQAQKALLQCLSSADEKVMLMAVKEVHDRLFGRPEQAVTDAQGNAIRGAIILLPAEPESEPG